MVAPLTDLTKAKAFVWTDCGTTVFQALKRLTFALIFALPYWSQVFEVSCDTSKIGIGVSLGRIIILLSFLVKTSSNHMQLFCL